MKQGNALLRYVYQNVEMGKTTIPRVLEVTRDPALRKALQSQLREYESISNQAEHLLAQRGCEAGGESGMKELMSGVMVRMKTLNNKSPSHIAQMMIQGSTMGTIQITRRLHDCKTADGEAQDLANRLLRTEENNIQQMKQYL